MFGVISVAGIYFPAIFFYFLASLVLYRIIDLALSRFDIYKFFWHKALAQVSLLMIIFSMLFRYVPLR